MVTPASPGLTYRIESQPGSLLVHLAGEAGVPQMAVLDRCMLQVQPHHDGLVVIDLSELRFLCSLAIGALVTLHRTASQHGGRLRLAGATPPVRDIFARLRLDALFDLRPDLAAALEG